MRRGAGAAAVVTAGVLALAGCSSSSGGGGTGTGAVSTVPPTSSASLPSSSSVPASPTATITRTVSGSSGSADGGAGSDAAAGPGACTSGDLTISASASNGATGHDGFVLYFHNRSSSTCTLHGYPGLDALAASGSLIAHATRTLQGFTGGSRRGLPTVPVAAGQDASARVEWVTIQPGTGDACEKQSAKIAVTAANTTKSVVLNRSVTACSLQIHPTVPGRTGNLT